MGGLDITELRRRIKGCPVEDKVVKRGLDDGATTDAVQIDTN